MEKIILICLLDFINRLAFYAFFQINQGAKHDDISDKAQKDIIIHLDIIVRYLFSIFLLKIKVHRHHKFAFFLILINFLILIPTDVTSLNNDNPRIDKRLTYIYIGFFSVRGILFPLEDVIIKKVFTDDYILPEEIMFFRGLGEFVLIITITPILYFSLYRNFTFLFGNMTKIILTIILYTLSSFVKAYLLLKVIYFFSSQSVSFLIVSESITSSIAEIINFFKDGYDNILIVYLLIEIIVILNTTFGTLVYDEIIVIKKCGMDINVAAEIALRGRLEVNSIGLIEDDDNDDIEEEEDGKINHLDVTLYE